MVAHTFMDDIDWFVWEPVASAHIDVDGGTTLLQVTQDDLDEVVCDAFPGGPVRGGFGGTLTMLAPVGRFQSLSMPVRVPIPATRGDILRALHAFYAQPATLDHVAMLKRRVGGSEFAERYIAKVEERLLAERDRECVDETSQGYVRMIHFCGEDEYGFPLGGEAPSCGRLGEGRRHPLIHCVGAVRFEGLRGDDASRTYDVLIGT
jgi:hypothetical protein